MTDLGRLRAARRAADEARPAARPGIGEATAPAELQPLGLARGSDGLLYVPAGHRPDRPAPLVVLLHGAGGNAEGGLAPLRRLADDAGLILLAPESRGPTWDVVLGGFGPDVTFIDRALAHVLRQHRVDPARLALGGFSDGASYALSLGLTNGDLFSHILAFAPGFMAPEVRRGSPRLFLAHGVRDSVLPIDGCSRRIVPELRRAGYRATYREFDGPHTVPAEVAREALAWLARGGEDAADARR